MTANNSGPSAAPDELVVGPARLGLSARGSQDRQAALSSPLQTFHRTLLGAFLTEIELLVGQADSPVPVFPTTALHTAAAVGLALADTISSGMEAGGSA